MFTAVLHREPDGGISLDLAVLYCEIVASNSNKQVLLGTASHTVTGSNYASTVVPSFLASLVTEPNPMLFNSMHTTHQCIYCDSPTVQAGFDYYYWASPPDPITFISTIDYTNVSVRKDVWGWVRCSLGLGIGFNIAINTLHVLWTPDVYPSIQRRALFRALLLVLECAWNDWWYLYVYALGQGAYRIQYADTLVLAELPRANGIMLYLAVSYAAARLFQLRVKLFLVVAMYFLCFSFREWIVTEYGVCTARAELGVSVGTVGRHETETPVMLRTKAPDIDLGRGMGFIRRRKKEGLVDPGVERQSDRGR
ncbi:Aste57867_11913 [Aphanomyces stellatus]|uniref:Aste57867_11913 protein n=1 Tax=Aphanomyces stellatus TaxID=120398 RepID=A0A485KVF0_9STRA|nr:hypothetical protein As57867_011868 [Aphanomyces stellatus]VFT88768.1 Aste57867_11913 [Aphanomyces stellatus]